MAGVVQVWCVGGRWEIGEISVTLHAFISSYGKH